MFCINVNISLFRNQAKPLDSKEEAARAAAKAEKEKKDAMANIDINNYASSYIFCCSINLLCIWWLLRHLFSEYVNSLSRCYIRGRFEMVVG